MLFIPACMKGIPQMKIIQSVIWLLLLPFIAIRYLFVIFAAMLLFLLSAV